jgi:hypothetical protein
VRAGIAALDLLPQTLIDRVRCSPYLKTAYMPEGRKHVVDITATTAVRDGAASDEPARRPFSRDALLGTRPLCPPRRRRAQFGPPFVIKEDLSMHVQHRRGFTDAQA